jgi:hypothetical protein
MTNREGKPMNWYILPTDSPCEVRKVGSLEWRPHRTRRELAFEGYCRRSEGLLHFLMGSWELKVGVDDVLTSPEPMPEGAAKHLASI